MEDLTIAVIFMALISIGIFFVVRTCLAKAPALILDGTAAVLVILIGIYVRLVWGQLWIVRWIPLSSVIVLSNWFPLLLGALAGVLWVRTASQSPIRRLPAQLMLIAGAIWSMVYAIPTNPPQCQNEWTEASPQFPFRICHQTTKFTCSAAACATILSALGIETSEAEMAALCLTGEGTTWLGIYHGLSVRLRGSGYRAEFFECGPEELNQVISEFPALLCCELTADVDSAYPQYQENGGWRPGVKHSTVVFGAVNGAFVIGDPSQKQPEIWSPEDMANLWTGRGLKIVRTAS